MGLIKGDTRSLDYRSYGQALNLWKLSRRVQGRMIDIRNLKSYHYIGVSRDDARQKSEHFPRFSSFLV